MRKTVFVGIARMVAGILVGLYLGYVNGYNTKEEKVIEHINVYDYVDDKDLKWALEGMTLYEQINWMNNALSANQDLVWKYAHYEECVNTFLDELDSVYNIKDMYPGYLEDAEYDVQLQWELGE